MIIRLTSKRQATFPKEVCEALDLKPGARLEILPSSRPGIWRIRPLHIQEEKLAPLRGLIKRNREKFSIHTFRKASKNYEMLRD